MPTEQINWLIFGIILSIVVLSTLFGFMAWKFGNKKHHEMHKQKPLHPDQQRLIDSINEINNDSQEPDNEVTHKLDDEYLDQENLAINQLDQTIHNKNSSEDENN